MGYYTLNYDQMIVVCKQTYDVSWYRTKTASDLALQICSAKNISSAFKQLKI